MRNLDGKEHLFLIFFGFLAVRVAFILISGYDSYELYPDTFLFVELGEKAAHGDFNFDIGRFISAPFYPCFIALHKLLLGNYWDTGLVVSQLVISSLSGVFFFKLGLLLFPQEKKVAYWSTALFAVFPLTLYWVHTFSTEMLFQSLFIISIYYFLFSINRQQFKLVIFSSIIFSFAFLSKSHILLFTPFIAVAYLLSVKTFKRGLLFSATYATILLASTLPFGIYNMRVHGEYVLSSNGMKFHFYTGNSEMGYVTIVKVPPVNTEDFYQMKEMNFTYFNGSYHDSIMKLPQPEKQSEYFRRSLGWIKANPEKFIELKFYNFWRFVLPGVSYKQYPFKQWLLSFLVSLPVYLFGYFGVILALRKDFKVHFFVLGIFLSLLFFSVVFYAQNRFRTITAEPFYILYSTFGAVYIFNHFLIKTSGAGRMNPRG